ncbi:hypothetical protein FJ364_01570 [Candidatus Dependentiae bacterium]|nr:hypothetical protein [Candidatus Dependentiae bacterium]
MEIFIPVHQKDLGVLPTTVASVCRFVTPQPTRIVFVSNDKVLKNLVGMFGKRRNFEFLRESSIIPDLTIESIPRIYNGSEDRRGWYFQQLLKLSFSRFAIQKYYAVFDADMVLVRDLPLFINNKYIFYQTQSLHKPYFITYEKLFGYERVAQKSFICNFMVFDCCILEQLKQEIETRLLKRWDLAILSMIDQKELSSFSEFETYGNFFLTRFPDECILREYKELTLSAHRFAFHPVFKYVAKMKKYIAITYHNYRR